MTKTQRKPARADIVRVVGALDDDAGRQRRQPARHRTRRQTRGGRGEGVARRPLGGAAETVFDLLSACPGFGKAARER